MHCSDDEQRLLGTPATLIQSTACYEFKTLMEKQCEQKPNCKVALCTSRGYENILSWSLCEQSPQPTHGDSQLSFIKQRSDIGLYQISYPSAITPIWGVLVLAPAFNHLCLCGFPKCTDLAKDSIALLKWSHRGGAVVQ